MRDHFKRDEQERLIEYVGPSEHDLCTEFADWIEDNPPQDSHTPRTNRFNRSSKRTINQRPKSSRPSLFTPNQEEPENCYTKVMGTPSITASSSSPKSSAHNNFS